MNTSNNRLFLNYNEELQYGVVNPNSYKPDNTTLNIIFQDSESQKGDSEIRLACRIDGPNE